MFQSKYVAKKPDPSGYVAYTEEENSVWKDLYAQQIQIVENYACLEYLEGLKILAMPNDRIPQLAEINAKLLQATGWQVEPVPALIPYFHFFDLLANKKFPAATFIRSRKDFGYITEPDIFHEYFGHCPMITFPPFASFMEKFGQLAKNCSEAEQGLLARLYWFTVEFGLIRTPEGLKVYGGGILSSPEETIYALDSPVPKRVKLDLKTILNTEFRIDIKQTIYFIIEDYKELYSLASNKLLTLVASMV